MSHVAKECGNYAVGDRMKPSLRNAGQVIGSIQLTLVLSIVLPLLKDVMSHILKAAVCESSRGAL
jgi:hypothetical protein